MGMWQCEAVLGVVVQYNLSFIVHSKGGGIIFCFSASSLSIYFFRGRGERRQKHKKVSTPTYLHLGLRTLGVYLTCGRISPCFLLPPAHIWGWICDL